MAVLDAPRVVLVNVASPIAVLPPAIILALSAPLQNATFHASDPPHLQRVSQLTIISPATSSLAAGVVVPIPILFPR